MKRKIDFSPFTTFLEERFRTGTTTCAEKWMAAYTLCYQLIGFETAKEAIEPVVNYIRKYVKARKSLSIRGYVRLYLDDYQVLLAIRRKITIKDVAWIIFEYYLGKDYVIDRLRFALRRFFLMAYPLNKEYNRYGQLEHVGWKPLLLWGEDLIEDVLVKK